MNKISTVIVYIILITLLTGCWDYKELEDLALVSGMSVDILGEKDAIDVTIEVLDLGQGDVNVKPTSQKLESSGQTLSDAVVNALTISAKKLSWSHAMSIIVSEDVAREGIWPIVDWIYRYSEPRITLQIYISKEPTANELLSVKSLTTDIRAYEIDNMLISDKYLSKTPELMLYELMNELNSKAIYPVLPALESYISNGTPTIALAGGAILNGDKLVGFLEPDDVKYYLFLRNKMQHGTLIIDSSVKDKKDIVSLYIIDSKTKINPVYNDGELSMKIDIKTDVVISEIASNSNYISQEGQKILTNRSEAFLRKELEKVIEMVQVDYGLDIFGFGEVVKDKMPDLWREIEDDWVSIFKELKVDVNTNIKIRNSGHFKFKE